MRILLLVLLLLAGVANAAAPSLSCTLSRSSGTAPLGVVIDCSATTDSDTSKPFHDLFYTHTFGDPGAGLWTYGANTSLSKNFATGPIAAHVYETGSASGTVYTITTTVSDGTNIARTTNTVTVTDANTTYSTANTKCFYQTSASGDCPNGGTESSNSDWDNALSGCVGTTKRCLFQRGSTFTASATTNVSSAGPITIGAYGTGAKPIVNVNSAVYAISLNNAAVNDIRIHDIDCRGTGAAGTDGCIQISGASVSGLTILRVNSQDTGSTGILLGAGSSPNFRKISNSVIQEVTASNNFGGTAIFARMDTSAILGSSFGPVAASGGEHPMRIQRLQKTVISSNTMSDAAVNKETVTLRSDPHSTTDEDSFYWVFSDNKILQGTRTNGLVKFEPTDNLTDGRLYDGIAERNWIVGEAYTGASTCNGFKVSAVRITLRNNLVDLNAPTTCARHGINIFVTGVEPSPDDINAYNNTFYSATTSTAWGVTIGASSSNAIVKNNLCWYDNGTGCINNSGTNTTSATNSTNAQATGTDPSFDTPLTSPIGFRIGTGSYAASGGTAIWPASNDDFYHCDDTTANEHIGAFIPRTRATCRGAAGP